MTVIKPNSVAGINSITVESGSALSVHKADGTLIRTLSESTGISTFSSISVGSATTTNNADKSINIGLGASISQPETNSLSLGTGGDERARIDSSGRLLLGTTTEGEATADDFTIGGSNDAGITLRTNTSGTGRLFFSDGTSGDAEYRGYIQYSHSADTLQFGSGGSTRVTIDSSGQVGINTTTESISGMSKYLSISARNVSNGGSALEIVGNRTGGEQTLGVINFVNNASNVAQITAKYQGSTTLGSLQFFTSDSEKLRITSAGRVGISSQSPSTRLDVTASDGTGLVKFKNIASSFSNDCYTLLIDNTAHTSNMSSAGSFAVETSATGHGTRAFTIAGDGDVGIGTASPDGSLTICHTSTTDMLTFNVPGSVGTFAKMGHNTASGSNMLDIRSEGHTRFLTGGNNERLRLQSDGTTIDQFISQNGGFNINVTSGSNCAAQIRGKADRSATGNTLLSLHGDWDGTAVTMMDFQAGDDTTNKDDGTIDFYTRPSGGSLTHRLRIDHNGDVIMGNTGAFNSNSDITPCFAIGSSAHARPGIVIRGNSTNKGDISFCDNSGSDGSDGVSEGLIRYDHDGDFMVFHTADSERFRVEGDGQMIVSGSGTRYNGWAGGTPLNVTSVAMINVGSEDTNNWGWGLRGNSGDTQWCLERIKDQSSFSDSNIKFRVYENGNYLFAGSDSSDRDIKENIVGITTTGSLNNIKQLLPRTYNFKSSEGYPTTTRSGFIAQEVAAVIPSIVNGTDGQKNMGIDYNGLVAHLVNAIKELEARVATLEGG